MSERPKPPDGYESWCEYAINNYGNEDGPSPYLFRNGQSLNASELASAELEDYATRCAELAAQFDLMRIERDRLRVLLGRARANCTCHATMRPDIKCLSCAIAEELAK